MTEKFYANGLHFECTQCGMCCLFSEGVVYIDEEEEQALAQFLNLSRSEFHQQYVETEASTGLSILTSTATGACIFFKDNRCEVYPARPLQCRTYPFWPENLRSLYQWKRTRQECPGIGNGKRVPGTEIERMRQQQQAHDVRLLRQSRLQTK